MTALIDQVIETLSHTKTNLDYSIMSCVLDDIFTGKTSDKQNADFLYGLAQKGESDQEILCVLDKMHKLAQKIPLENTTIHDTPIIDMCGTGGDSLNTINISTAASFVVAASGGVVAKHGNRSSSSILGSADVFEYFGYNLDLEPTQISDTLHKHKICFIFAQKFHPAMRHVSAARKQLLCKTIFNLAGPLSNPICIKNQLVGVSSTKYLTRIPKLLQRQGAQHVITVSSDDGLDELSTSSTNHVAVLYENQIQINKIDPLAVGLHKSSLKDLQIKTRDEAAHMFVKVLDGTANRAMTETVALNAAGGLIVSGIAHDFEQGIQIALDTIHNSKAYDLFEQFLKVTSTNNNNAKTIAKLKEIKDANLNESTIHNNKKEEESKKC